MLSDDLPIFDELCQRFLLFIYNCFFHSSSLVKFVSRYGIMFSQHNSNLASNFYFHFSQFKFNKKSFYVCINIHIIYQHRASTDKELNSYWVAKIMKDCIVMRYREITV